MCNKEIKLCSERDTDNFGIYFDMVRKIMSLGLGITHFYEFQNAALKQAEIATRERHVDKNGCPSITVNYR